jgi:hypothetical protein
MKAAQQLTGSRCPQAQASVARGGGQQPLVVAERDVADDGIVVCQDRDLLAGFRVPDPRRAVLRRRR